MENGIWKIAPEENFPWLGLDFGLVLANVRIRIRGKFSSRAIVLEPVGNAYEHLE